MELYHGSEKIIEKPKFGAGKMNNDFGQGLYCTESVELAMEWACKRDFQSAFVNKYDLDVSNLKVMNLSESKYNVLSWISVLLENREVLSRSAMAQEAKEYLLDEFLPDYSSADVLIGYRADDSYFSIARAFLQNTLPLSGLDKALRLGRLGEQVVLKSKKAFDSLLFLCYVQVPCKEYYSKKTSRDIDARCDFEKMQSESDISGLYLVDIIRNKIKNGDARLF